MNETRQKIISLIKELRNLSENEPPNRFEVYVFVKGLKLIISAWEKILWVQNLDKNLENKLKVNSDKLCVGYNINRGIWIFKPKNLEISPLTDDLEQQALFLYQILRYLYDLPEEFDVKWDKIWTV